MKLNWPFKQLNSIEKTISNVIIKRLETSNEGTFGILSVAGFSCYTGELPNRNNAASISCIPKGTYSCKWTKSPRMKKWTYELEKVSGRTAIRIHSANFVGDNRLGFYSQMNGCIALGQKIGKMNGQKAILISKPAIRQFEEFMNKKDFTLEIQ